MCSRRDNILYPFKNNTASNNHDNFVHIYQGHSSRDPLMIDTIHLKILSNLSQAVCSFGSKYNQNIKGDFALFSETDLKLCHLVAKLKLFPKIYSQLFHFQSSCFPLSYFVAPMFMNIELSLLLAYEMKTKNFCIVSHQPVKCPLPILRLCQLPIWWQQVSFYYFHTAARYNSAATMESKTPQI